MIKRNKNIGDMLASSTIKPNTHNWLYLTQRYLKIQIDFYTLDTTIVKLGPFAITI